MEQFDDIQHGIPILDEWKNTGNWFEGRCHYLLIFPNGIWSFLITCLWIMECCFYSRQEIAFQWIIASFHPMKHRCPARQHSLKYFECWIHSKRRNWSIHGLFVFFSCTSICCRCNHFLNWTIIPYKCEETIIIGTFRFKKSQYSQFHLFCFL